ncbi:MAG: chromate transporter [Mycoplasma sp.]
MISLLIALVGCLVISFIVFGGGQVFIPFFKILLVDLMEVDSELWEAALTMANSTPGVFSTKLAFISGYLAAGGEWWGYIAMFGTYIIFMIVPITVMFFAMKGYKKIKDNRFINTIDKFFKPVTAGILAALIIQLLFSAMFPFIIFNESVDNYVGLKTHDFFNSWRMWVLISYVPISIVYSYFLIYKKKVNIIFLIIGNIGLCMLLFQPWLT